MFTEEAVKQIAAARAIDNANAALTNQVETLVALPRDFELHDLEKYQVFRRRARGRMETESIADFAAYTIKHAEEGASVFVGAGEMTAVAVLNLGSKEEPGHTDNRAVLKLKATAAYAALKGHTRHRMSQISIAEFFEDWAGYVTFFSESDSAQISPPHAIAAIRKISIDAMRKMESSVQYLSASKSSFESVTATSATSIPTTIYFECEPYHGLKARTFVMQLSIQTSDDKPTIILRLVKEEQQYQEMAQEFADITRAVLNSDISVLLGSYSNG